MPSPSVVAAPRGRSDHQISLDFVEELRGAPASDDESALLLEACDACAEDPDADMLVTAANGSG
jgi:exonuclease SbcD